MMKSTRLLLCFLFFVLSGAASAAALNPGQSLSIGQRIYSNNSKYFATMQDDGNFVVYTMTGEALWSTDTHGLGADHAVMQEDGNFVLYSKENKAVWSSNTTYHAPSYAAISDYGQWVVYKTTLVWTSNTSDHSAPAGATALVFGQYAKINQGQSYVNGNYLLIFQSDGNLVLYGSDQKVLWSTGTTGQKANSSNIENGIIFVANKTYTLFSTPRANLGNINWPDSYLLFQADGNLVMYVPEKVFASPSKYAPKVPTPRGDPGCYGPPDACIGSTLPVFTYQW